MEGSIINKIFSVSPDQFPLITKEVYQYQIQQNLVYRQWASLVNKLQDPSFEQNAANAPHLNSYPFIPISFFKSHKVICGQFEAEALFESSGTTNTVNSQHLVKDVAIYRTSFTTAFELFYGAAHQWCVIGLLPNYLERQHSSLVMMVEELITASKHPSSGFYLHDFEGLHQTLLHLESTKQPTLLIGVTFALLDFAAQFPMQLQCTTVMETGGMKGRRKEMTRTEVHQLLKEGLGLNEVHSEYGMTELLSQAYSVGKGLFQCPPWMRVLVRDEDDPLAIHTSGKGVLNVIDLANIYSCSFIATEDVGIVYEDGSFEVLGRLDNSDIRGCSLLVV